MNQITDKIVKISLISMILLSLFLSWKIWTKPANRSLAEKDKDNTSELVQTKKMTDVYVPTKLFYHKDKEELLYSNKETTIVGVHDKLRSFEFQSNKELDEKATREAMYTTNSFNLFFPKELPISVPLHHIQHIPEELPLILKQNVSPYTRSYQFLQYFFHHQT